MLLLAAAITIRRTPWPAHGPDSVLLYAEDEAGLKLGHAAVEVSGIRCGAKLSLKVSPSPKPNPNPNPNPNQVCGIHCGAKSSLPEAVQRPLLSALFVNPDHRRRGVAGELMQAAEEQAVAWGHGELVLNVQRSNEAAQGLYAKSGYAPDVDPEASPDGGADSNWWARWWHGQGYVLLRKPLGSQQASPQEGDDSSEGTS